MMFFYWLLVMILIPLSFHLGGLPLLLFPVVLIALGAIGAGIDGRR